MLGSAASATEISSILFMDEAIERGVVYTVPGTLSNFAGMGIGLADLDHDGDLDLIVVGAGDHRFGVFENDGTGYFTDRSHSCGLPILHNYINFAATDLDGDGLLDLVCVGVQRAPRVFRNLGNLLFEEISATTGIDTVSITAGIASGDLDGDGWVDLYIGHYSFPVPGITAKNQIWRNQGDGTFVDIAPSLGMATKAYTLDTVIFDPDLDGHLDIYVSNDRGHLSPFEPNRFYHNDGGTFTEIGQSNGTGLPLFSMGVAVGDFTGNGFTDLYCTNAPGNVPPLFGAFPLFEGSASGNYSLKQATWGVGHQGVGWAAIFFDADNNGTLELFVASSSHPPCLYRNPGSPPAINVTSLAGIALNMGATYGAAVGDINGDGKLDLVINPFGSNVRVYINRSPADNAYALLRIVGERRDTQALGATVQLTANGVTQTGHVLQGGNGYLGQNGFDVHFGLGNAKAIDQMVIRWPYTGSTRTLMNYAASRRWTIHPPGALGDFDGDGLVSQSDLSALSAFCGGPVLPGWEILDMNGDGVIDALDVPLLVDRMHGPVGDFNGDGIVDGNDLGTLLGAWGSGCVAEDLNADGVVDGADLGTLLGNWGA